MVSLDILAIRHNTLCNRTKPMIPRLFGSKSGTVRKEESLCPDIIALKEYIHETLGNY